MSAYQIMFHTLFDTPLRRRYIYNTYNTAYISTRHSTPRYCQNYYYSLVLAVALAENLKIRNIAWIICKARCVTHVSSFTLGPLRVSIGYRS